MRGRPAERSAAQAGEEGKYFKVPVQSFELQGFNGGSLREAAKKAFPFGDALRLQLLRHKFRKGLTMLRNRSRNRRFILRFIANHKRMRSICIDWIVAHVLFDLRPAEIGNAEGNREMSHTAALRGLFKRGVFFPVN
jgi:hypothetical protein